LAFGITRKELINWKSKIDNGEIAFITHYWLDERFPNIKTVTKVGCLDIQRLAEWGAQYGLLEKWIHMRKDGYSHFDLLGERQRQILEQEGKLEQLDSFLQ